MELLNKNDANAVKEYEEFVDKHINGSFMQSIKWTKVKSNWKSEAVIIRDSQGKITGTCLVLIKKVPVFNRTLLYAPRGPVCDYDNKETMSQIVAAVEELAKKYKACNFTFDPFILEDDTRDIEMIKGMGFTLNPGDSEGIAIQCRSTYILNVEGKTSEEVMNGFKPDWRNRIRKAGRKGVVCKTFGSEKLDDFYPIMKVTGERDNFIIRSYEYLKRFIDGLGDSCRLFICYADIDGKEVPLSGAITVNYSGTVTYVYGASSNENRNLYPNYLMQWTMISWAIDTGCRLYDFGGIPGWQDENNPKYGIYKFKKGFGGEAINYAGEFIKEYKPFFCKLLNLGIKLNSLLHHLFRK